MTSTIAALPKTTNVFIYSHNTALPMVLPPPYPVPLLTPPRAFSRPMTPSTRRGWISASQLAGSPPVALPWNIFEGVSRRGEGQPAAVSSQFFWASRLHPLWGSLRKALPTPPRPRGHGTDGKPIQWRLCRARMRRPGTSRNPGIPRIRESLKQNTRTGQRFCLGPRLLICSSSGGSRGGAPSSPLSLGSVFFILDQHVLSSSQDFFNPREIDFLGDFFEGLCRHAHSSAEGVPSAPRCVVQHDVRYDV